MKALIKGPAIRASISRLRSTGILLISMALFPVAVSLREGVHSPANHLINGDLAGFPLTVIPGHETDPEFCLRDRSVRGAPDQGSCYNFGFTLRAPRNDI